MRSHTVLLIIFCSLYIAVTQYRHKSISATNDISAITLGIKGIDSLLSPGQSISFRGNAIAKETYLWARYVLAPRHLAYHKQADTTLIIYSINNSDSLSTTFGSSKTVLWERRDNKYHYLLLTTPTAHE